MKKYKGLLAVLALAAGSALQAQTNELVIQAGKPGAEIQPTMYGLFFEDINYAADGGLYAELVKNRSFEFPQHFMGWKTFGKVSLKDDGPFERNPHYVRLAYAGHPHKQTGLDNEGFFGIGIKKGAEYRFSVWARVAEGETPAKIRVELADTKSMGEQQAFATADVTVDSREWKKYQVILKPEVTNPKAILRIFLASRQTVDLEHISLFPVDTWQGHENGLRKDLAQALADIKPGVFRFPGGCIVEGTDIASRYDWKKSVGMVENRPLNENRWQYTFPHRFFPDYYQSYGLGFYEFFQLSEEIGAEPLPVLSCGLACQFQNPNMDAHELAGSGARAGKAGVPALSAGLHRHQRPGDRGHPEGVRHQDLLLRASARQRHPVCRTGRGGRHPVQAGKCRRPAFLPLPHQLTTVQKGKNDKI